MTLLKVLRTLINYLNIALVLILFVACKQTENTDKGDTESQVEGTTKEQMMLEIKMTDDPIVIDGKLLEPAWLEAEVVPLRNNATGEMISNESYFTSVRSCYDNQNLYIAFVNNDKNIFTRYSQKDEFLWQDEVVEVFIDGDPGLSTYLELEVSPTNVVFDSYITDTANIDLVETPKFEIEGLETAVQVNGTVNDSSDVDHSWTVEILIPLYTITQKRTDKKVYLDKYRINFYRINRDSQGPSFFAWSPTLHRFHGPSSFGEISLKR